MLHRLLVLAAAAFVLSCGVAPAATVSGDPYEINVIISLTGPAAFAGKAQQISLALIENIVNREGGIRGRPLKFVLLDDQSNPQIAVQLAGPIVNKNVPVFIGSDLTAPCLAIGPLVTKSGPVQYCTSPGINPPAGGYVFSASASTRDDAVALVRYLRLRGWTHIGVITSIDASGQSFENAFDRAMAFPENHSVVVVDREHFNITDLNVSGQITRLKAANPQAIIAWTTGTPFATLLRGFHDGGVEIPIAGGNANMTYPQMTQYADFLPKELYFPGRRGLSENTPPGPVHDAQQVYFRAYKSIGVRPDLMNNMNWDAAMIVVDALQHLGTDASADQVRDYILQLHSWAGINGIYDFRDGYQRGLGLTAIVMDRWDPVAGTWVPVSKPGGYLP